MLRAFCCTTSRSIGSRAGVIICITLPTMPLSLDRICPWAKHSPIRLNVDPMRSAGLKYCG